MDVLQESERQTHCIAVSVIEPGLAGSKTVFSSPVSWLREMTLFSNFFYWPA